MTTDKNTPTKINYLNIKRSMTLIDQQIVKGIYHNLGQAAEEATLLERRK
jgi:hypothetical protein